MLLCHLHIESHVEHCAPARQERLSGRGTFSGSAGEAVVYGVRQPEAIAAQLLISDGDPQRC